MCAVMKADAYGNGIGLPIPSAIRMGITCIGVASNEEARVAREKGFKGKKSITSLRNAADSELARAKIAASQVGDGIRANLASLV